jgi:hypothetical protein
VAEFEGKEIMAANWRVSCINKRNRQSAHERIENIGGLAPDGSRWKVDEATAISGIETGKWAFYVSVDNHSVWVVIATHNGRKYLKTQPDGYSPDNLLSLPECP